LLQGASTSSGLQYLRNRYFDASTGRFTQQDPIGLAGGLNLYGFAQGDPVNFGDPLGLGPCEVRDLQCLAYMVMTRLKSRTIETAADAVSIAAMGVGGSLIERGLGTWGRFGGRAAKAAVDEGKLGYLFGRASGSEHNVARAAQNAAQMSRLGATEPEMLEFLTKVGSQSGNVTATVTNRYGTFEVRESLFAGRTGEFAKIESTWQVMQDGTRRFVSAIPYGRR
jgi:RHS repeat-associated protein